MIDDSTPDNPRPDGSYGAPQNDPPGALDYDLAEMVELETISDSTLSVHCDVAELLGWVEGDTARALAFLTSLKDLFG